MSFNNNLIFFSLHSKSVKDLETSQKLRKEATKKLEVAEEQVINSNSFYFL